MMDADIAYIQEYILQLGFALRQEQNQSGNGYSKVLRDCQQNI